MLYIRQGATHKVVIGPAVAVGDGFTPVTTLAVSTADEAEVILHNDGTVVSISGYTFAAITTADGYYHLTLQSGISNTVGHMTVVINDDSLILPLRADFTVIEEAVYDALYASGATGFATAANLATAQSDLDIITGTDGALIDSANDVYHALIEYVFDDPVDEYTVTWFKNGARVTSGITVPTIQVVKRADGTDLVASAAMSQIGTTGSYKYDEATDVVTADESYLTVTSATIDAGSRSFACLVQRAS